MKNRTSFQNIQFKLNLLFISWLVGLVAIPFFYLFHNSESHNYVSGWGAIKLHSCILWDQLGHTNLPILNVCSGVAAEALQIDFVAQNHKHVLRAPLYSALFTFFLAGALFGGRNKSATGAVRDVRQDAAMLKKMAKPFDPAKFINLQKGIFWGVDENRKPIYLPQTTINKNHIEVLGESGVGKSSLAGVLLSQLASAGECVVVFDPKNDRNLPGVLSEAGRTWGEYPVHVLDLRPVADFPQVNPFKGCRSDQVEELLQVALELGKTGDPGVDFYRGGDREATGFLAESLADGETDMLEIITRAATDERVTRQENLWRELRQLNRIKAFQTEAGLDLVDVLSKPGVLYVIGSTTKLEVVAGQKLLLQRILQIIDERADQSKPVAMFLDELKYILSPAALRAAGTIRDRNCHLLFAHQSLGDLADCPGLNPNAVKGAIWGNSGIKIAYKMLDAGTARELQAIAGQTAVEAESQGKNSTGDSSTRKLERSEHMPAHVFTHLPKPANGEASVGVVFGLGTAFYLSTRYLPAGEAPKPISSEPVTRPAADRFDSL